MEVGCEVEVVFVSGSVGGVGAVSDMTASESSRASRI